MEATTVIGNPNDYGTQNNGGTPYQFNGTELVVGALDPWDNVIGESKQYFEIPSLEEGNSLNHIDLKFSAKENGLQAK